MDSLISNGWGYLQIYRLQITLCLLFGGLIEMIVLFMQKKGYIRYKNRNFKTILCEVFLLFSITVVITMTLYGRAPREEFAFRFQLFGSYIEVFRDNNVELLLQIIMNVIMFVPLGLFLPCCFRVFGKNRLVFLTALFSSGGIELIQGIARIGMFEMDDILGNVVGAEIGYLIWWGMIRIYKC